MKDERRWHERSPRNARPHNARLSVGRRARAGFTAIELMITIALLAVLAAIALPGLSIVVKNNRLETALGEVPDGLIYARAEAVTRSQNITVCPTTDGAACNGTAWQDGLLVFTNANPSASAISPTSKILKYIQFNAASQRPGTCPWLASSVSDTTVTLGTSCQDAPNPIAIASPPAAAPLAQNAPRRACGALHSWLPRLFETKVTFLFTHSTQSIPEHLILFNNAKNFYRSSAPAYRSSEIARGGDNQPRTFHYIWNSIQHQRYGNACIEVIGNV
jgi:prepilin-type N-terminal cleavage/methylation domain-containing protein